MKDELMKLKIARELCDNSKIYDVKFIDKILDIAINSKGLNDYVKDYEVSSNEDKSNVAEYNGETKKIVVYEKNMGDKIFNDLLHTTKAYSETEKRLYINSFIAQVLLHEVEHANQKRIVKTENGLESSLLKLCEFEISPKIETLLKNGKIDIMEAQLYIETKLNKYTTIYTELYECAPHERLAQIKSYQEIIDSLGFIDRYNIVTRRKEIEKLGTVLNGYDDTHSPTITYLSNQGREEELKQFDWYNEDENESIRLSKERYNLKDRMKFGLPIDSKERQFVKEIRQDMSL